MSHENLVNSARGKIPFDTAIENGLLINVYTGEIHPATIGIIDGMISYISEDHRKVEAKEYIDAKGKYIMPGMIDSHMHIESSMVTPASFAQAVLPRGTTSVVADPHEIGNVLGVEGVKMMLDASKNLPLKVYTMVPSTMPSLPGFETPGAETTPAEVEAILDLSEDVLGLGEVMDFHGVVDLDKNLTDVIKTAKARGVMVEGHDPVLLDRDLQAFIAAGVDSNHTKVGPQKMRTNLRSGVAQQLQQRDVSQEMIAMLGTIPDLSNFSIVTDDVTADHLTHWGHLDYVVRQCIKKGLDPIKAVQSCTIAPARRMRLYDRGGIGPGRVADIVFLSSLEDFIIDTVFVGGKIVAQGGELKVEIPQSPFPKKAYETIKLKKVTPDDFSVKTKLENGTARVNVVCLNGTTSYTTLEEAKLPIEEGKLKVTGTNYTFMSVFERHGINENKFTGVLKDFTITGAVATTYAHDSHNMVCYGDNEEDMAIAVNYLIENGGGLVAVQNKEVIGSVSLPIAGLLSEKDVAEISQETNTFAKTVEKMGLVHEMPIMVITILALVVSPTVKISDMGLVDVNNKQFLDLIIEEKSN